MKNKINLSDEIIVDMKSKESTFGKDFILLKNRDNVYKYLLNENIEKIFGKTEFDSDELEIVRTREGMQISTIFGIDLTIKYDNKFDRVIVYGSVNNQVSFTIQTIGNTISNTHLIKKEDGYEKRHYVVDVEDASYHYYDGVSESENVEYTYGAELKPMNAKHRSEELFELTREIPKEEKAPSVLKRIVDNLRADNIVRITTSNELVDIINFSEEIFERLKKEAEKYRKQNNNDGSKKELKKNNNI